VGENRFVHAPKSGKAIAIVSMRESYCGTATKALGALPRIEPIFIVHVA